MLRKTEIVSNVVEFVIVVSSVFVEKVVAVLFLLHVLLRASLVDSIKKENFVRNVVEWTHESNNEGFW